MDNLGAQLCTDQYIAIVRELKCKVTSFVCNGMNKMDCFLFIFAFGEIQDIVAIFILTVCSGLNAVIR